MGDSSGVSQKLDESDAFELTGKIVIAAIIILFFLIVSVFSLHLYIKWFRYRQAESATGSTRRRRRRFHFAVDHQDVVLFTRLRQGLDPSVLKSIPVVLFRAKEFPNGLECAVCLSEVNEGEKARFLPKCKHAFHVDCIDMWLHSHSTCPLCRNPVSSQSSKFGAPETTPESTVAAPVEGDSSNIPPNVLFFGNGTPVRNMGSSSSSSLPSTSTGNRPDRMLVIDIPRQVNEEEEQKSPMTTRLRSLKRLLSRDRRVSPRFSDPEQGSGSQG